MGQAGICCLALLLAWVGPVSGQNMTNSTSGCLVEQGGCSDSCSFTDGATVCSCFSDERFLEADGKTCSDRLQIISLWPSVSGLLDELDFTIYVFTEDESPFTSVPEVILGQSRIDDDCYVGETSLTEVKELEEGKRLGLLFGNENTTNPHFTAINCIAPVASAEGVQNLTISFGALSKTLQNAFIYCRYRKVPSIESISPMYGVNDGTDHVVEIWGQNLGVSVPDIVAVFFGKEECFDVEFSNSSFITCVAPKTSFSTVVSLTIITRCGGSSIPFEGFTYLEVPEERLVVSALHPNIGSNTGGTLVRLHGKGFRDFSGLMKCRFGDRIVDATVDVPYGGGFDPLNGTNTIVCKSPPLCENAPVLCRANCTAQKYVCLANCTIGIGCPCHSEAAACFEQCDSVALANWTTCLAQISAAVPFDFSLNGNEYTSSGLQFYYHSHLYVESQTQRTSPLAGSSISIQSNVSFSSEAGISPTCRFGANVSLDNSLDEPSNVTHFYPFFQTMNAEIEWTNSSNGPVVLWHCVIPRWETVAQVFVHISLNNQEFSETDPSRSISFYGSDNWFLANTTGTEPSAREMGTLTTLTSERAFLFGGYGRVDAITGRSATGFLNSLFELRMNARNRDNYPEIDVNSGDTPPLYSPAETARDLEWVEHKDLVEGAFPAPRAGHTLNALASRFLIIFGGQSDSNITYPLHHINWAKGMEIETVVLDRNVVGNPYKRPDELELQVDHWRVRESHTRYYLEREMVELVDPDFSFDQDAPSSIYDQSYFGSFGYDVSPHLQNTSHGIFGNGGIHDWKFERKRTIRYNQYTTTLNDLQIYDVEGTRWLQTDCAIGGDLPHERLGHSATLVGNMLYVFGGWSLETCPLNPYMLTNQTLPCVRAYNDMHKIDLTSVSTLDFDVLCENKTSSSFPPTHSNAEIADTQDWDVRSMPTAYTEPSRSLNWASVSPLGTPPSERMGHSVVYSSELAALIVFGGKVEVIDEFPSDSQSIHMEEVNDLHLLDLSGNHQWYALGNDQIVGYPPPARSFHSISKPKEHSWVFGGTHKLGYLNDLYRLTVAMSTCGTACSNVTRVPFVSADEECVYHQGKDGISWESPDPLCIPSMYCCYDVQAVWGCENADNCSTIGATKWTCDSQADTCVRAFWLKANPTGFQSPGVRTGSSLTDFGDEELYMFGGSSATIQPNDLHVLNVKTMNFSLVPTNDTLAQVPLWTPFYDWGSCSEGCHHLRDLTNVTLATCQLECENEPECNYVNHRSDTNLGYGDVNCGLEECYKAPKNSRTRNWRCFALDRGSLRSSHPPNTDHHLTFVEDEQYRYVLWNPDSESICQPNDTRWHCQEFVPRSSGTEEERAEFDRYTVPHELAKDRFTFQQLDTLARVASQSQVGYVEGSYQQTLAAGNLETNTYQPEQRDSQISPFMYNVYLQKLQT